MFEITSCFDWRHFRCVLVLICSAVAAHSGCKPPTQTDVAQQYGDLVKRIADRLDRVNSVQDADAAAADVNKLLAASDRIIADARQAEARQQVPPETKQYVENQLERLAASRDRLVQGELMTQPLIAAIEQLGYSTEAIAAAAAASGALPAPKAPLDEAWITVIQTYNEQAELLSTVKSAADAEREVPRLVEIERKRHAALTKVAELGGEEPPHGVPEAYRRHYDAAKALVMQRDAAVTAMLGQQNTERLAAQIQAGIQSDPALAQDPFRLPAAIRRAGSRATITLINNKSLGERHRPMIDRLKELAGASEVESVIDNDGTYRLVLAPVADFGHLVKGIDFGEISQLDQQAMSFTLTIDPTRFAAAAPAAEPAVIRPEGRPPFGRPGAGFPGGTPPTALEREKARFASRVGGPQKCVTLVLEGAPDSKTTDYEALVAAVRRVAGVSSTARFTVNGRQELMIGPVDDLESLAGKIDFGVVTATDAAKREITIAVDASKLGGN